MRSKMIGAPVEWRRAVVLAGMLAFCAAGSAGAGPIPTAQIFLGDFNGQQVVRWSGNTPDTFVSSFGVGTFVEGMGGYSVGSGVNKVNHVLVGAGANILDYIVNFPTGQSLAHTIANAGFTLQMTVANDGNSFYAAQGGNGISQFSIVPGNYGTRLNQTAVKGPGGASADVWGVAVNPANGDVIASANWAGPGEGVHVGINEYDSSLHFIKFLVPYGDHGLTHGAGITFAPDGSFYVVQGGNAVPLSPDAFVLHYAADGTYLDTLTAPAGFLNHAFQPAIGPDGNLYVSNQAGNCVVRFNTTTQTFMDVFISASATAGNGEESAKTIFFTTNTIAQTAPEPASIFMALSGSVLLGGWALRRRDKLPAVPN